MIGDEECWSISQPTSQKKAHGDVGLAPADVLSLQLVLRIECVCIFGVREMDDVKLSIPFPGTRTGPGPSPWRRGNEHHL